MEPSKSSRISQSTIEKHTVSFLTRCTVLALSVVWIFVSIPILVVVLVIVVIAWMVYRLNSCCSHIFGSCPEFLTTTELFWLLTSKDSPSILQCLIKLDSYVTVNSVRDVISNRISNPNTAGSDSFLRLQKRLVRTWVSCAWYRDNDFSLENHVTELAGKFKSEVDVETHIALMTDKEFESERPLWNIQLLQCGWENRTYLLVRVHPCFANGNAFLDLLCQPVTESVHSRKPPEEQNSSHPLLSIISAVLFGPLLIAYFKLSSRSNSPNVFPGMSPSGKHAIAWSRPVNFQQVLESRVVANCHISDFALCAAAGTVRSILPHATLQQGSETFMTNLLYSFQRCSDACVISCTPEVPLDAQFATIPVQLPLRTEGIIPRLWDTLRTTRTLQQYCAQSISCGVLQILTLLIPSRFSALWLSKTLASGQCLVSHFQSSQTTMSLAGATVLSIVQWFPPGRNSFMSFSVQIYNNELRVGVVVDTCLYAKANTMAEQFATEIDTLITFLAHRRVLRKHRHKKREEFEDIDEFDDYLDQENDQDVTFDDEICRPCWSQRGSDITQDENDQPHSGQEQSLEIIQLDEPSSPEIVDGGVGGRRDQLFIKTHHAAGDGENLSGRQDGVTIHVVSEDVPASVISVEEVKNGEQSPVTGDQRPPNTSRRESHGMTVITSVAVNVTDSPQTLDFSPCVERRLSVPADV
eukprot:XP_003729617.1 PREDICTED: uncharacterized protein LOC100893778 [Strongylocentrotus purpuratus]